MSEINGAAVVTTTGTVGTPATTPGGQNKPTLRERLTARKIQFEAKHPGLCRAGRWVGRGVVGAGLFLLGRKTAKPVYITATVSEPEPEVEETQAEAPEVEETPTEEI